MLKRHMRGRCVEQGTAMLSNISRLLLVLSAFAYKSFLHTYRASEGLIFYFGSYMDCHFR
jgi:hypothetical protein